MWALATIKPNGERSVGQKLERRKLDFHIFRYRSRQVRAGRVTTILRPVFPRYVFVPTTVAWLVRHEVDGVLGLVCFGSGLATVPPEVVEDLVRSCADGDDVLPITDVDVSEGPVFAFGDRVVPVVGTLVGQMGVVVRRLPTRRVRVEFDFVGKRVFADLPPADLRIVERSVVNRRRRRYSDALEDAKA